LQHEDFYGINRLKKFVAQHAEISGIIHTFIPRMNRLFFTIQRISIVTIVFGLFACSKGPEPYIPNPDLKGEFRFLANGNPVYMEKIVSSYENVQTQGDHLTFSAAGASGYVVSGCIYGFKGVGTYDLSNDSSGYVNFTINNWQYTMGAGMQPRSRGSITVSDIREVDEHLVAKGFFEGVAFSNNGYDSVLISDGVFADPMFQF
jgi:hypothetical protein